MRVFYGVALITGIIIANVHGIAALAIIHKISSLLFAVGLIAYSLSKKLKTEKKRKSRNTKV